MITPSCELPIGQKKACLSRFGLIQEFLSYATTNSLDAEDQKAYYLLIEEYWVWMKYLSGDYAS